MTFSQLYLQECSPAKYRGLVLSCFMFWTSIGTLVGTIVDNFTAPIMGKSSYLIPLGLIYIVPAFICFGLLFVSREYLDGSCHFLCSFQIPESPRWLLSHGHTDRARIALLWLRPYPDTVEAELHDVKVSLDAERKLTQGVAWLDLFRNPVDRRRTFLAVAAITLQAASGAMFMIAYGTYFFEMVCMMLRTAYFAKPGRLMSVLHLPIHAFSLL